MLRNVNFSTINLWTVGWSVLSG